MTPWEGGDAPAPTATAADTATAPAPQPSPADTSAVVLRAVGLPSLAARLAPALD